jgi:hypothetical protein
MLWLGSGEDHGVDHFELEIQFFLKLNDFVRLVDVLYAITGYDLGLLLIYDDVNAFLNESRS